MVWSLDRLFFSEYYWLRPRLRLRLRFDHVQKGGSSVGRKEKRRWTKTMLSIMSCSHWTMISLSCVSLLCFSSASMCRKKNPNRLITNLQWNSVSWMRPLRRSVNKTRNGRGSTSDLCLSWNDFSRAFNNLTKETMFGSTPLRIHFWAMCVKLVIFSVSWNRNCPSCNGCIRRYKSTSMCDTNGTIRQQKLTKTN